MFYHITLDTNLRPQFWQKYSLSELNDDEWEALCDGCGVCCLHKFMDDDPQDTEYTDVACQLLDCTTGQCSDYANRKAYVADCIRLTPQMMPIMMWLPRHCAYKRLYLGQNLPRWHYLVAGQQAHAKGLAKVGTAGRAVSECGMTDEMIEERVVRWVRV
ncbi:MAG: YcgN family cysteine cluster protein [Moraxella sp.]|nr:YcgN family cysteine cluster protein [Moraxella sp.]